MEERVKHGHVYVYVAWTNVDPNSYTEIFLLVLTGVKNKARDSYCDIGGVCWGRAAEQRTLITEGAHPEGQAAELATSPQWSYRIRALCFQLHRENKKTAPA